MKYLVLLAPLLAVAQTSPATYTIHTYAGTSWTGDGRPATSAVLVQPSGLATDALGNLYIADAGDHRVRMVGRDGAIRTVAGTGQAGFLADNEPAVSSQLNAPYGLAIDAGGALYIADLGNARIRRLGSDGRLVTVAGGGTQAPSAIAGPATGMKLSQPRDIAVDRRGNLYIADFGTHMVYQVTPDGILSLIAGTGEAGGIKAPTLAHMAPLSSPAAVAVDAGGNILIADSGNRRIRRLSAGWLTTVLDKSQKEVELGTPTGIAVDSSGRLYIADGGTRLTVVWPTGDLISLGIGGTAVSVSTGGDVYSIDGRQIYRLTGSAGTVVAGSLTGAGAGDGLNRTEWRFQAPSSILLDGSGSLIIADTGNGRIRRLTQRGELSTLTTRVQAPTAVALDSQGRLHVADRATGAVYRLDGATLRPVLRAEGRPIMPVALAFDRTDNLFVADTANHVIRRVAPDGASTVHVGGGTLTGDGPGLLVKLASPSGLAFDQDGALWFTEAGTARLRRFSGGRVTTVPIADLMDPRGLRVDSSGDLLVADAGLHRVLRVAPDGMWIPLAGSGDKGFSGDEGPALAGSLNAPMDVCPSPDGTLFIVDSGNNRIRQLKPEATVEPGIVIPPAEIRLAPVEVLHAATRRVEPVAPGQLVYVTGERLERAQVSFAGLRGTILNASETRLTVHIPPTLRPGVVEVVVQEGAAVLGKVIIDVSPLAPAILTAEGGSGQALAVHEDGTANSAANPAPRAGVVSLFLTGEGGGAPRITATIGGYTSEVLWAGPAPGLPGVYQVNLRMPGGFAPSGSVGVTLTVAGARTQPGVTLVSR